MMITIVTSSYLDLIFLFIISDRLGMAFIKIYLRTVAVIILSMRRLSLVLLWFYSFNLSIF